MTTPIKIKRSGTASSTPSSLDHGELAINYADDTLFWKDSSNVIQSFVFQAYASATHKSQHATGGSDALEPSDIGAAPAASPTFTGTATFEGVILADDSTSTSTPVYSFTGDQNCGIAHPAADAIGLVETGFERFRVSSAGVDVYQLSAGTDVVRVRLNNESGTGQVTLIGYGASFAGSTVFSLGAGSSSLVSVSGVLGVGCLANQPLVLATNNSERMRITGAGSVGIGRTSPASALDVNGVITVAAGTAAAPAIVGTGDADTGVCWPAANNFAASTAGVERLRIDSNGMIGINATPNSRKLTVRGSSTGDGALLLQSSSTGTATTNGFIIQCFGANSDAYVWNFENAPIIFGANNAERMRLYADGKLDVTNSVWAVNGSAGSPGFTFRNDTNTGIFQASGSADTLSISTAGVERVRVTSGGTLAVTTNLEIHGGATAFPTADTSAFIGRTDATGSAPFDQAGSLVYRPRVSSTAGRSSHMFYTGSPSTERMRIKETGAVRFVPLSADPASGEAGDVYYNSSTNELQYHNGSAFVGAAPAASPAFTGVITVSATSGSAGSYAPSVTFSGDPNTGFGQVSGQSDTASVFTAGHERVRVGSTNQVSFFNNSASSLIGGNTGITIGTGSGNSVMSLYGGTSSSCVIYFADGTSSPSTFAGYINYSHSTNDMTIATNGTGRVRVKNTGALNFAPLSADPASGEAGDVYYNSSTNKLRVYDGTSWIDLH